MILLTREKINDDYGTDEKSLFLSDSVANPFIPIHAGFEGTTTIKRIGHIEKKVLFYNKIADNASYNVHISPDKIIEMFLSSMRIAKVRVPRCAHWLNVKKGVIYCNLYCYKPLIMLTIDRKYLFEIDWNNIDYTKLCLHIDHIYNTKQFSSLRTVFKSYLDECVKSNMNIMYTSDINSLVYRSSHEIPTFDNVDAMKQYLKSLNNLINE